MRWIPVLSLLFGLPLAGCPALPGEALVEVAPAPADPPMDDAEQADVPPDQQPLGRPDGPAGWRPGSGHPMMIPDPAVPDDERSLVMDSWDPDEDADAMIGYHVAGAFADAARPIGDEAVGAAGRLTLWAGVVDDTDMILTIAIHKTPARVFMSKAAMQPAAHQAFDVAGRARRWLIARQDAD